MIKLTKIHLIKILMLYTFLALATVFCYNSKKILGTPKKRPFQCFDEALSKPFVYDTVPPQQLYLLAVYFPIAFITVCELLSSLTERKSLPISSWILKYVLKCCTMLTLFAFGLAIERSFKNVAKIKMARLRPNFLTVCDPKDNTNGLRCSDIDEPIIITDYQCSSNEYPFWAVNSAFVSFPSGHTSLTSYAMVFLMGYLHLLYRKLQQQKSPSTILILIAKLCCLLMIPFVGASRVFDFRHHWTDVFAGFILGSSVALVLSWYLKTQMDNIDKWLNDIMGQLEEEKSKSSKTAYTNENVSGKQEEACTIELAEV